MWPGGSQKLKTHETQRLSLPFDRENLSLGQNLSHSEKISPLSPKISCAPVQFMGFPPPVF